jgi:hypothetical protein
VIVVVIAGVVLEGGTEGAGVTVAGPLIVGEGVVGTAVVVGATVTVEVGDDVVVEAIVDDVDVLGTDVVVVGVVVEVLVVVGSVAGARIVTVRFLPVGAAVIVTGVNTTPLVVTVTPVPVIRHGVAAARIRLNWTGWLVGIVVLIHVETISVGVMVTTASGGVKTAMSDWTHGP